MMFPATIVYLPSNSVEDSKKAPKKAKPASLERNISCPQCGRFFRDNYHLNLHIKIHENRRAHKCSVCPKAFVTLGDLKRHLLGHSDDTPYKCRVCDKSFKAQSNRKLHEDTHGLNTYKCRFCSEKFKKYMDRSRHEVTHKEQQRISENGKVKFECSYCSNFFASLEFKENHEAIAHKHKKDGVKPIHIPATSKSTYDPNKLSKKCPVCSNKFKSRREFRSHVTSEHPEKVDKIFYTTCKLCHKKVSTTFISYHTMAHNGVKPHACGVCDAKFSRKSELNTHRQVHSNEKCYECVTCQKDFKTLRGLRVHELNHKDAPCYKCVYPSCNKTYNTQSKRTSHLRKCHQKYLEKCEICGKETYNIYMKKHIREEHDFEEKLCDHCGITFENEAKLKKHIIAYKYNSKCNLKTIKTKTCSFCSYRGTSKQIKYHCQNKHKEQVFSCCICFHVEFTRSFYEKHMRTHGLGFKEDLKLFEFLVGEADNEDSFGECDLCGYIPTCRISLSNHMQMHSKYLPIELSTSTQKDSIDNCTDHILENDGDQIVDKLNSSLRTIRKTRTRLKISEQNVLNNFEFLTTKEISLTCDSSGVVTDFNLCDKLKSSKPIRNNHTSLNNSVLRTRSRICNVKNNRVAFLNLPKNISHKEETIVKHELIKVEDQVPAASVLPMGEFVSVTEPPLKHISCSSSTKNKEMYPKNESTSTFSVLKEVDPLITIKGKQFISLEDLQKLRDVNIGTLIDLLRK